MRARRPLFAGTALVIALGACGAPPPPAPPPPRAHAPAPADAAVAVDAADASPPPTGRWSARYRVPGAAPRLIVQTGHAIHNAALSPDGHIVATTDREGVVVLWDADTGRELRRLLIGAREAHCSGMQRMREALRFEFSADSQLLLMDVLDHQSPRVELWSVARGERLWLREGSLADYDRARGLALVVGPEPGKTGYGAKSVAAFVALGDGKEVARLEDELDARYHVFALSPDGRTVAGVSNDKPALRLWDARTGKAIAEPLPLPSQERAVFDPQGDRVVVADGLAVRVIDARTGKPVAKWPVGAPLKQRASPLGVTQGGAVVLTDFGEHALILDLATGKERGRLEDAYAQSLHGDQILGSVRGPKSMRWDAETARALDDAVTPFVPLPREVLVHRPSGPGETLWLELPGKKRMEPRATSVPVARVHGSASNRIMLEVPLSEGATGRPTRSGVVFDLSSSQIVQSVPGVGGWDGAALSPDGGWVLTGGGGLSLYSVGDPRPTRTLRETGGSVFALGRDARWAMIDTGLFRDPQKKSGPKPVTPQKKMGRVQAGAVSADGKFAAGAWTVFGNGGARAGALSVWSSKDGRERFRCAPTDRDPKKGFSFSAFEGCTLPDINKLAFDRTGDRLAISGGYDCAVSVWDAQKGKPLKRLGHGDNVQSAVFEADGDRLVTAAGGFTGDNAVRVFDAAYKEVSLFRHDGAARSATFLQGRDFVVSTSDDHTTRFWDLRTNAEVARLVFWPDGAWLVVDPEGRFDTNAIDRLSEVHWSAPDEPLTTLPLEAFMRDYFHPGLLAARLSRAKPPKVPDMRTLDVSQPKVEIVSVHPGSNGRLSVHARVTAEAGGARDLRLFRDGQLVARHEGELDRGAERGDAGSPPSAHAGGGAGEDVVFDDVQIPSGVSTVALSAYAFNRSGVKSATARVEQAVDVKPRVQGRALLLHVGVDKYAEARFNLGFATADARVLADNLKTGLTASGAFSQVRSSELLSTATERGATKAAFLAALGELSRATPDDVVIVTFAGHGATTEDGAFNLLFADFDGKRRLDPAAPGVLSDEELAKALERVDAREVIFVIDACQSAAAVESGGFKPGPLGSRGLGQIAYDKGMRVLAATQADNVALESNKIGHGLLTHALAIEGLGRGAADDHPKDGAITLEEWLAYGASRVPSLADAMASGQAPQRGLVLMTAPAPKSPAKSPATTRATQEPRLFDYRGRPSRIVVRKTP